MAIPVHESLDVLVHHRVHRDVVVPHLQVLVVRQLALDDQVGGLEIRALLGQLLDRIAAVTQDALVAVDVRDTALARSRVGERRIVGHQAEIVGTRLDLSQVHRSDRAELDGNLVLLPRAVIGDG